MTARPAESQIRAHEMSIYKRYFDLIAAGSKTTEIRVNDSSRKRIKPGSLIRFRCEGDEVLTRVTRIAHYPTFGEMFDHEDPASVNPLATREEQLASVHQIYSPEREALGVIAIGIELANPPRTAWKPEEGRRLFSEVLGTFFLVLVAVGEGWSTPVSAATWCHTARGWPRRG